MIPQHIGLGSKTALLLAIGKAMAIASREDRTRRELQLLSHRGGASGIGIHSFFTGGFVVDSGHPQDEIQDFMPSAAGAPADIPVLSTRGRVPSTWQIHLVLPRGRLATGRVEKAFFRNATPLPKSEVYKTLSAISHGIVPAFLTSDLGLLRSSLETIHRVGFKARELAAQTKEVRGAYSSLRMIGMGAVGMSSMGPLLYLICKGEDSTNVREKIVQLCRQQRAGYLGVFRARNSGFQVRRG